MPAFETQTARGRLWCLCRKVTVTNRVPTQQHSHDYDYHYDYHCGQGSALVPLPKRIFIEIPPFGSQGGQRPRQAHLPPPFNMSEGTDCLHKRVMRIIAKLELKTCDHDHQHMISLICPFAASSAKFLTWPSFKYFDCD